MKTVEEIYREMLDTYARRTGVEPEAGCDLAARLYALAAQVYALQVQTDWVARQSFPQTAEGESLDRHAQVRGLERKQAVQARGTIRFFTRETAETDWVIPLGTVCMTAGLVRFETIVEGVIPAGSTWADVPARAVLAGSGGNVSADTIVTMAVAPVGVAYCRNLASFTGGSDRETDEQLRIRVLDTFRRLPNGANAAYYEQECMAFDGVAAAVVVPRPRGIGTVDVVVAAKDGLPGQSLLTELTEYFTRRREIAVDLQVRAPQTAVIAMRVQVRPREGVTLVQATDQVRQVIRGWFGGQRLGKNVLLAQLNNLLYQCEDVENYAILSPAKDVLVERDELPMLGTLTVEGMI